VNIPIPQQITGVEERLQAKRPEQLRQKRWIANEFAEGKLNRAQFTAVSSIVNDASSSSDAGNDPALAWQRPPGHTSFLRQHFEARVLCAIQSRQ
jgi:hypothetical protein